MFLFEDPGSKARLNPGGFTAKGAKDANDWEQGTGNTVQGTAATAEKLKFLKLLIALRNADLEMRAKGPLPRGVGSGGCGVQFSLWIGGQAAKVTGPSSVRCCEATLMMKLGVISN